MHWVRSLWQIKQQLSTHTRPERTILKMCRWLWFREIVGTECGQWGEVMGWVIKNTWNQSTPISGTVIETFIILYKNVILVFLKALRRTMLVFVFVTICVDIYYKYTISTILAELICSRILRLFITYLHRIFFNV